MNPGDERTGPEFSRRRRLDDLTAEGTISLSASARECGALARRFGIESVSGLTVTAKATELAPGAVRIGGTVSAQIAVAGETDAPALDFVVGEPFEEIVATAAGLRALRDSRPDEADDAELAAGETVDLGELAAQILSLAIDPVMIEAASFEEGTVSFSAGEDDAADGPFAALDALRPEGE